jgi:hypothetical protein
MAEATLSDIKEQLVYAAEEQKDTKLEVRDLNEKFGLWIQTQDRLLDRQKLADLERSRELKKMAPSGPGGLLSGVGGLASGFGGLASGFGGLLGGLGKGIGFAGLGVGAGLLGLSSVMDKIPDPEEIKDGVETLLSIGENYEDRSEFLKEGGTLGLMLGGIGAGLSIFSIGQGAQALAAWISEDDWAQEVKDNVETLLSITSVPGADVASVLKLSGTLGAMGVALAAFGIGQTATSVGQAIARFTSTDDWAQEVKDNVATLLEIPDLPNATLGNIVGFPGVMGSLALGLTAFGIGQAISGLGAVPNNISDALKQFTGGKDWSTKIRDNVKTLLEIPDLPNATLGNIASFPFTMGSLAVGLAAFALGQGVEGLTEVGQEGLSYFTDQKGFAERVKSEVKTLLEIPSLPGIGGDTTGFIAVMGGIATGLAAFALGKGLEGVTSGFQAALSSFTGTEPFAERIKSEVSTLLSIPQLVREGDTERFTNVMSSISTALAGFGAGEFIGTLANAGASIVNFFTGGESPFEQIRQVAEDADQLVKGADAIDRLQVALDRMGDLRFDGSDLNLKEFAQDLKDSVPIIEKAITGDPGGLFTTKILGLASPEVDYESAVQNIRSLRAALGYEMDQVATAAMTSSPLMLHGREAVIPLDSTRGQQILAPFSINRNNRGRELNARSVETEKMMRSGTALAFAPVVNAPSNVQNNQNTSFISQGQPLSFDTTYEPR